MREAIYKYLPRILTFILIFWIIAKIYDSCTTPEPPDNTNHWNNLDSGKNIEEIKSFNYTTGEVEYVKSGPHPPSKLKPTKKHKGEEELVNDRNIEMEDLIDYESSEYGRR